MLGRTLNSRFKRSHAAIQRGLASHAPFSPTQKRQSAATVGVQHGQQPEFLSPESQKDVEPSVYSSVSTFELIRAVAVFRTCQMPWLVKNSQSLVDLSYTLLGKSITNAALKKSFFGHFCAGEDESDVKHVVDRLESAGIKGIFDYAAEADVDSNPENGIEALEMYCDSNTDLAISSIKAASNVEDGFIAMKCTAMGNPALQEKLSSILNSTVELFHTIYESSPAFSSTLNTRKWERQIDLSQFKIGLKSIGINIDDHKMEELFRSFDCNEDGSIDYFDWIQSISIDNLSIGELTPYVQTNVSNSLNESEIEQLKNTVRRLISISESAQENGVKVLVDAEQTYLLPISDFLIDRLGQTYNRSSPILFKTYQCYMKDSSDRIEMDLAMCQREKIQFACKLVRGAYMVQERARAKEMGYESPIHETIEDTHHNYNSMVELLLQNNKFASVLIASHNEQSVENARNKMQEYNVPQQGGGVYFAQLLGMCDHVSYDLGYNGFQVYKYLPYGPVDEALPYLLRRAQENSDIMAGATKEINLLSCEIKRRIKNYMNLQQ